MEKLKFNPDNAKYYSEEFIKGFECGIERQFNADMEEKTAEWIDLGDTIQCPNCKTLYPKVRVDLKHYCERCGARMKGES